MELAAGGVVAGLDPEAGGRLASLQVDGRELLVTGPVADPLAWGCYPMVPWAGRLRHGRFAFAGEAHQVPVDLPPHAIHGLGYRRPWEVVGDGHLALELADPWPFGGRVEHRVEVTDDRVRLELTVTAGEAPMPVLLGWHPWFRRVLDDGTALTAEIDPARAYELDDEAIPTGRLVDPPPHPWDHCFTGLAADPVLRWGDLSLTLSSSCGHWQVYEPEHALCVEPQTGAPDQFNRRPTVLTPGGGMTAWFVLRLRRG